MVTTENPAPADQPHRSGEWVNLSEAADLLQVHYQTAYRWVRSGRLRGTKVHGQYVVATVDIERARSRRAEPQGPPPPGAARLGRRATRMHHVLVEGDETSARAVARQLVGDGASVVGLIDQVLVPALRSVGHGWQEGRLAIAVEHRATAIVGRILGDLAPNPRGRRRGVAVVAALSGDRHGLPTEMAAAALREDSWHVHHLGADLPRDELDDLALELDADLVVLTVTNLGVRPTALEVSRRLIRRGTPTLVGGPGRTLGELLRSARDTVTAHR